MGFDGGIVHCIDDDEAMCACIRDMLEASGHTVRTYTSAEEAIESLKDDAADVVLTDVNMGGMSGIDLCRTLRRMRPDVLTIVATAFGSLDTAVEALRAGAHDFVTKPLDPDELNDRISRAIRHRKLEATIERIRNTAPSEQPGRLIGSSTAMHQVYDLMGRAAPTDVNVLITGETGTGKELVARGIHELSARRDGPFVAINCAAVPGELLESELFGHAKGAFTDARQARRGLFLEASGGTLFLDEIGEMPEPMQAKLLRALQERMVRPVGADREVPYDARLIAATNRDLRDEVQRNHFREDLYYRINVVTIAVPPLRERGEDILHLAEHFVRRFAKAHGRNVTGLAPRAADALMRYSWPGNVRELENCIERGVALARMNRLTEEELPRSIQDAARTRPRTDRAPRGLVSIEELERDHIMHVLEATDGNRTHAAEILGIDRKTLYRKLRRYGVSHGASA